MGLILTFYVCTGYFMLSNADGYKLEYFVTCSENDLICFLVGAWIIIFYSCMAEVITKEVFYKFIVFKQFYK